MQVQNTALPCSPCKALFLAQATCSKSTQYNRHSEGVIRRPKNLLPCHTEHAEVLAFRQPADRIRQINIEINYFTSLLRKFESIQTQICLERVMSEFSQILTNHFFKKNLSHKLRFFFLEQSKYLDI